MADLAITSTTKTPISGGFRISVQGTTTLPDGQNIFATLDRGGTVISTKKAPVTSGTWGTSWDVVQDGNDYNVTAVIPGSKNITVGVPHP
jgi:hypothetical protein